MALERIGLGGVLTFTTDQAERSIKRVSTVFDQFKNRMSGVSASVGRVGGGLSSLTSSITTAGASMLPMTAAIGYGTNQAASFEQQMSAVAAVSNASASDMQRLTDEARRMGMTSAYSATQAGQAMENLKRAGASTNQVISSLGGTMNLAAAEGMELSEASTIVARSTRIMNREWSQAANTADILVLTSQSATTNVSQLGEAVAYGGPAAYAAGLDFEELNAILGKLSDSGAAGSAGGTALSNALNKLANPTDKAQKLFEKFGITMSRTANGGVDLVDISDQINTAISGIEDPLERNRIAVEIFGVRGRRAFSALSTAGKESTNQLISDLRNASDGIGVSAEAARKRLDNLKGAITLLKSALEELAISTLGTMLSPLKDVVRDITSGLTGILEGMRRITGAGDDVAKKNEAITATILESGDKVTSVILGITDALKDLKDGFQFVKDTVVDFMSRFTDVGPDMIRTITRIGVLLALASAVIGPLLLGIGGVIALLVAVGGPALAGIGAIISGLAGLFWPIIIVVGAAILAFTLFRNEGESIGETFTRIWQLIKDGAIDFWENGVKPIYQGIKDALIPAIQEIEPVFSDTVEQVKTLISAIAALFSENGNETKMTWREVGQVIGATIGAVLMTIVRVVRGVTMLMRAIVRVIDDISTAITTLIEGIQNNFNEMINSVKILFGELWESMKMIWSGNAINGLKRLADAILEFMLEPIKVVGRAFITLFDAIGAGETVPTSLREWTRAGENIGRRNRNDPTTGIRGTAHLISPREQRESRAELNRETLNREQDWDDFLGEIEASEISANEARERRNERSIENARAQREEEAAAENARRQAGGGGSGGGTNIESSICIDGHELAIARQRHDMEVGERAGFKATPWQRRIRVEQGVMTTTGR
jgi:TP901 family phage tail tape measure protein